MTTLCDLVEREFVIRPRVSLRMPYRQSFIIYTLMRDFIKSVDKVHDKHVSLCCATGQILEKGKKLRLGGVISGKSC